MRTLRSSTRSRDYRRTGRVSAAPDGSDRDHGQIAAGGRGERTGNDRRSASQAAAKPLERADRNGRGVDQTVSERLAWPVLIFLPSLIVPWIIYAGPLRLTIYRIVLLVMALDVIRVVLTGKRFHFILSDFLFLMFWAWCTITLVRMHGLATGVQSGGILLLETMVPYLMGRIYVQNADDYLKVTRLLFHIILFLLPFALIETVTGAKPLLDISGLFLPTLEITMMTPRMGFWRAQGPFEHSIVFGAVCGSIVSSVYLVLGRNRSLFSRGLMTAAVIGTGACSLSSAPIAGMVIQMLLIVWNSVFAAFKARWWLLVAGALLMFVTIAVGSNQGVVRWYISHFTFDGQTGWFRLLIWELGSESVRNHPLFGIGFNEWARPAWMPGSIDNFWLLLAVRHGLPAPVLFFLALAALYASAARRTGLGEAEAACKLAYLICLTSFVFVSWTVHFLNGPYVLYMFIFGSGAWIGSPARYLASDEPRANARRSAGRSQPERGRRAPAPATANLSE